MNIQSALFPAMTFEYQLSLSVEQVNTLLSTLVQKNHSFGWNDNRIFQGKVDMHRFDIIRVPRHRYDVGCKMYGSIISTGTGSRVSIQLKTPPFHRNYKFWIVVPLLIYMYYLIYPLMPVLWWATLIFMVLGFFYTSAQVKKDMDWSRQFFDKFFAAYTIG